MLLVRIKLMTSSASATSDTWGKSVRQKSTNVIQVIKVFVMIDSFSYIFLNFISLQIPASMEVTA